MRNFLMINSECVILSFTNIGRVRMGQSKQKCMFSFARKLFKFEQHLFSYQPTQIDYQSITFMARRL